MPVRGRACQGVARRGIVVRMKRPLVVPDDLHRNHPDVHAFGPGNTGSTLIRLVVERLGLKDLSESDVLDIGCGVRFTQAIINCDIPIKSYAGVDVHRPLIDFLRREVDDARFSFWHWDAANAKYNPEGVKIVTEPRFPVTGRLHHLLLFFGFTPPAPP